VLREYAKENPPAHSVVAYIEQRLAAHYQCPPPPGLVERLLLNGSAVVFFDGLDELVDTARRREVAQRVENFATHYPLASVAVTSRRIGYKQAKLDSSQFSAFQLAAFTEAQTKEYAAKWFAQERRLTDQEPAQWAEAFARESAAVPDLRSNPLMLSLLCILYRGENSLPRNRPAVYERCSTLLFETWDSSRSINVDVQIRDLMEPVLRHLAHWLLIRNVATPVVTEEQLTGETARYLQDRSYEDVEKSTRAAQEFIRFCKGRAWVFTEVGTSGEGVIEHSLNTSRHPTCPASAIRQRS
jgi:predicted NACHT family NTPase